MSGAERRLDSWKEIAAHFNRDVTTVRRWERREGLPVHRHVHASRSSIYAYAHELDEWWASRAGPDTVAAAASPPSPLTPSGHRTAAAHLSIAKVLLLLFAAFALSPPATTSAPAVRAIAVLPFISSSASADAQYLSEGLTDAVMDHVAPISGLRVIARASVLRYRQRVTDFETVARELNVDAVLIGSSTMDRDRVAFSVELLHARSGRRLWQGRYAGTTSELLALERTLLADVARALGREPDQGSPGQPATLEAYWTYVQGRRDWNRRTPESLRAAARLFTRAFELDPAFALAYAGAADAETLIGYYRAAPLEESLARAEANARRALALNDNLAEAHAALGQVFATRWDWTHADLEYRRALDLNPNYATARHWYSNYLSIVGDDDAAIAQARLATALDPLSPIVRSGALANALRRAGRHEEALAEYARALEMDPTFWNARMGQAMAYAGKRMQVEAIREAGILTGLRPSWTASAAAIYGTFGAEAEARRLLRTVEQSEGISGISLAQVYASIGDTERAVGCLQRAFDARDPDLAPVVREPWFDRVRHDARVAAMVQSLALPQSPH
ncbi:MAG TPA: tetratricopeptide repeat protein [Vicinamibacterales bacterium]|jgi:TolB-like protein/tetratricopeptide (TPR) repeat protein|nr:tetratricopeptide repeat protein [Vicinamibacterales bacterium]